MIRHDPARYPFSPIIHRPAYDWPGGRRLAIYLGVNYDVVDYGSGLGPKLAPSQAEPVVMSCA